MASPSAPRLGYLGPPGTFTHEALGLLRTVPAHETVALRSVADVVAGVAHGAVDLGLVPLENSVEGEVTTTLDALIFDTTDLVIREEVVLPVRFGAWTAEPAADGEVTTVLSHPHAIAQCHRFIARLGLTAQGVNSTAEACEIVAKRRNPELVALASAKAAAYYGLQSLQDDVGDVADDRTRFVLVGRSSADPTGADRTTLVLVPPHDRTGILVTMLRPFSARGIDVASIVTRPLKAALGQYCFVVTCSGHAAEEPLRDAVAELLRSGVSVKLLGSYPAWPAEHSDFDTLPPGSMTPEGAALPGALNPATATTAEATETRPGA